MGPQARRQQRGLLRWQIHLHIWAKPVAPTPRETLYEIETFPISHTEWMWFFQILISLWSNTNKRNEFRERIFFFLGPCWPLIFHLSWFREWRRVPKKMELWPFGQSTYSHGLKKFDWFWGILSTRKACTRTEFPKKTRGVKIKNLTHTLISPDTMIPEKLQG